VDALTTATDLDEDLVAAPPVVDAVAEPAEKPAVESVAESVADRDNEPPDAPRAAGRRWFAGGPRRLVAVLAVLLVAVAAAAAVLGWKLRDRDDDAAAANQAVSVAKQYVVTLTSFDAGHFDRDLSAAMAGATGDFKTMYAQSAVSLKPILVQANSVSKSQVVAAGVQSASPNEVVVMLFVDSAITNVTNPTPRVDRNRIVMTMDKVDGRWLASKVDLP
jgi:Mce-associated membrane protein